MSDRLEEIKNLGNVPPNWGHCGIALERDQYDWMIFEIDHLRKAEVNASEECERLRAGVDSLFDAIRHGDNSHQTWLKAAIEQHFNRSVDEFRANQIPGRCGECAHWDREKENSKNKCWCKANGYFWGKSEFCNKFKPKEE